MSDEEITMLKAAYLLMKQSSDIDSLRTQLADMTAAFNAARHELGLFMEAKERAEDIAEGFLKQLKDLRRKVGEWAEYMESEGYPNTAAAMRKEAGK